MTLFLTLNGTFQHVEIGLFQDTKLLKTIIIKNSNTNKLIIPTIDSLLKEESLSLTNLAFIAANQGPGPFTTLRTILTTINALNFASNIPIIGIDSLIGLAREYDAHLHSHMYTHAGTDTNTDTNTNTNINSNPEPPIIVLLDAFNNDVYYCIKKKEADSYQTGYTKIDILLATLPTFLALSTSDSLSPEILSLGTLSQKKIIFIGNAAILHKDKIAAIDSCSPVFPDQLPLHCSLYYLGMLALEQWSLSSEKSWQKKTTPNPQKLVPLYLKKHAAEL